VLFSPPVLKLDDSTLGTRGLKVYFDVAHGGDKESDEGKEVKR
jgi:hypothetical protein